MKVQMVVYICKWHSNDELHHIRMEVSQLHEISQTVLPAFPFFTGPYVET